MIRSLQKVILVITFCIMSFYVQVFAGRLGEEFRVNSTTVANQDNPKAAVDSSGNFCVVWQDEENDGDGKGVFAKIFSADGSVKIDEFIAPTNTAGDQESPAVAMAPGGQIMIAWMSDDGDETGIWAKILSGNGSILVDDFLVNSYTTDEQTNPAVACDESGNFVITWASIGQDAPGEAAKYGVFAQRFLASGEKNGLEFQVNTFVGDSQTNPTVAAWPDGRFVIAWQSKNQIDNNDIYFQLFHADGTAAGSETHANTRVTYKSQGSPAVSVDRISGNFVITWDDQSKQGGDADLTGVFAKIFNAKGDSITSDFLVNSTTYSVQNHQNVAFAPDGNSFVITWGSSTQDVPGTSPYGAYGQLFSPGGQKIGPEFLVNTWTDGNQDEPVPVFLNNTDFVVIWESRSQASRNQYTQEPDSSSGVYAQCFTKTQLEILSITDIPEDEGGQVQIIWQTYFDNGQLFDENQQGFPVTYFSIWRVDESGMTFLKKMPNVELGQHIYSSSVETYAYELECQFIISAHSENPLVVTKSEPLSGISFDNLAPLPPTNLQINSEILWWSASKSNDVVSYSVYGTQQSNHYSSEPLAAVTSPQLRLSEDFLSKFRYFTVTAKDAAGNESLFSEEIQLSVSEVADHGFLPVEYSLAQNYPNPFNPVTTIEFTLKDEGWVHLQIFNSGGGEVAELLRKKLTAGKHQVVWQATGMSSGIYFYKLTAGEFSMVKKMVYLK